jgi:hypothetical protein
LSPTPGPSSAPISVSPADCFRVESAGSASSFLQQVARAKRKSRTVPLPVLTFWERSRRLCTAYECIPPAVWLTSSSCDRSDHDRSAGERRPCGTRCGPHSDRDKRHATERLWPFEFPQQPSTSNPQHQQRVTFSWLTPSPLGSEQSRYDSFILRTRLFLDLTQEVIGEAHANNQSI